MAIDIRSILARALLSMCEHKSLEKITVTELLKMTGVGRRTYYVYFRDKYDLINWIYESMIMKDCDADGPFFPESEHYYEKMLEYKVFMSQSCSMEGQNSLRMEMYAFTEQAMQERMGGQAVPDDFLLRFYGRAVTGAIIDWVDGGMRFSPGEMVEKMRKARLSDLREIFQ